MSAAAPTALEHVVAVTAVISTTWSPPRTPGQDALGARSYPPFSWHKGAAGKTVGFSTRGFGRARRGGTRSTAESSLIRSQSDGATRRRDRRIRAGRAALPG